MEYGKAKKRMRKEGRGGKGKGRGCQFIYICIFTSVNYFFDVIWLGILFSFCFFFILEEKTTAKEVLIYKILLVDCCCRWDYKTDSCCCWCSLLQNCCLNNWRGSQTQVGIKWLIRWIFCEQQIKYNVSQLFFLFNYLNVDFKLNQKKSEEISRKM